jgi:hypothetical protein
VGTYSSDQSLSRSLIKLETVSQGSHAVHCDTHYSRLSCKANSLPFAIACLTPPSTHRALIGSR